MKKRDYTFIYRLYDKYGYMFIYKIYLKLQYNLPIFNCKLNVAEKYDLNRYQLLVCSYKKFYDKIKYLFQKKITNVYN